MLRSETVAISQLHTSPVCCPFAVVKHILGTFDSAEFEMLLFSQSSTLKNLGFSTDKDIIGGNSGENAVYAGRKNGY